jgi:hypothetical protein
VAGQRMTGCQLEGSVSSSEVQVEFGLAGSPYNATFMLADDHGDHVQVMHSRRSATDYYDSVCMQLACMS